MPPSISVSPPQTRVVSSPLRRPLSGAAAAGAAVAAAANASVAEPPPSIPLLQPPIPPAAAPPAAQSLDLFMILFISVFLLVTATLLRLIPWPSPLHVRSRSHWAAAAHWATAAHHHGASGGAHPYISDRDNLRSFPSFPYGSMLPSSASSAHHPAASSAYAASSDNYNYNYNNLNANGNANVNGDNGATASAMAAYAIARSASAPSYEALIEMGESIGSAKRGLTDEQIDVLSSYVCDPLDDDPLHSWRGSFCAICRDEYAEGDRLRVLPCGDQFHQDCIAPWLRQQASCPLCRCHFA